MRNLWTCSRMLCLFFLLTGFLLNPSYSSKAVDTPRLLYSTRKDLLLLETNNGEKITTTLLTGLEEAASIDFLYKRASDGSDRSTYCWSEHFKGIYCATAPRFAFKQPIIVVDIEEPDGIAIDWVTEKLYWVDSGSRTIEVCVLADGSHRKVLYYDTVDRPRALALDPHSGYMYWTDWGDIPKIERAGMNGDLSTRSTIISDRISWPNGLTVDYTLKKIYWVDASLSYIHYANMDGSNRVNLKDGSLPHPFAVTVYKDHLYWTDWKNRSIFTCEKYNCSQVDQVEGNLFSPMDVVVYEPDRQAQVPNPCAVNNGGCSHLCLLAPKGSVNCACPTGKLLGSDNVTCDEVKEMVFLARREDLRMISLDTPDFTDSTIMVEGIRHAIAIDFDPVDRFVYWTDDEKRLIQRAKLDGSEQETIVNVEVLNPDGLAVDWVSRNIFWTDTGTDRIEVARLNGSSRRVIISDDLDEPRAIAVDPVNGFIYWTDWGKRAKIEKAAMDGSMRQVLVNDSLTWPNGIALDFEHMRLYWADAKLDRIERCNTDGSDRTVILDQGLPHIFGFDVAGKYMYWTDWQSRRIERADKLVPDGEKQIIVDQLPDLMSLRAIAMKPNASHTNGCGANNGECSHLCLNTPNGHVCACPMGMELGAENKKCIIPKAFLLFSQHRAIKRASIQYTHKDVALPIQNLMNVTALDIHVQNKLLYFADSVNGSIRRSFLNGSAVTMVLKFTKESPAAMAIDWLSGNLYFIDQTRKIVEVFNAHGNARRVVLWNKLGDPRNIALHPSKGFIYWTDWNYAERPVIGRADLDGSDQRSLLSSIGRCGSINIDMDADRIYWLNYDRLSIQSATLDGDDVQTIKGRLTSPVSLNIYDNYVYWYDLTERAIRRVSKINSSDEAIIQTNIHNMVNLLVFHDSRQQGRSNCRSNNGNCQYFCFSTGRDQQHKCGCPTHYLLNSDKKTCSAPKSFLLLSEKTEESNKDVQIKRLLDNSSPDLVLPLGSMRSVRTLEYDSHNNKIYWIVDASKVKAIRRSSVDGSDSELFVYGHFMAPSSMAIDPYSQLMFWVDSTRHVVNVTTLNKVALGVVYANDSQPPQVVAVSPRRGYLFILTKLRSSDETNKVLRSHLDGSQQTVIVTGGKIGAITIDQQRDRLYYSDDTYQSIRSCDFFGQNSRTLVRDVIVHSLTIYKDKLYYTQGPDARRLFHVNRDSGNNRKLVLRGTTEITDIHAVNDESTADWSSHLCARNNGDCTHICYLGENGDKKCGCPLGLSLSGEFACQPLPTCKPTEFRCRQGPALCIPPHWRCDGQIECADGSDEENCPKKCDDHEFSCVSSGECIDKQKVCNRIADCVDSSDETACCPPGHFMCTHSFQCISSSKVGDGIKDCSNGSDEPATAPIKTDNPYTVGIIVVICIVSVFILFIIVFVVWKCHKRSINLHYTDPGMIARQVTSLDSLGTSMLDATTLNHVPQSVTATTVISASSGTSGVAYDRNHVTGASSSSSSMTHLQAGFNPPPSPVTERSAFIGNTSMMDADDCSTLVSSAYPTYHAHGKRLNVKVPPTTPISTCDDSEPSVVNFSTQRPKVKRKSNKKYHLLKPYGATEPLPPPPTPSRSQICSADEASECPPSPSTVRSFRSTTNNPYPPPPSPEPTSDNS